MGDDIRKWSITFLLLILCLTGLKCQEPQLLEISREDGLPHRTVFGIDQDTKRALLIGTTIGLFSYDGFNFRELPYGFYIRHRQVFNLSSLSDTSFVFINYKGLPFHYHVDSIRLLYFPGLDPVLRFRKLETFGSSSSEVFLFGRRRIKMETTGSARVRGFGRLKKGKYLRREKY